MAQTEQRTKLLPCKFTSDEIRQVRKMAEEQNFSSLTEFVRYRLDLPLDVRRGAPKGNTNAKKRL